SLVFFVDVVEMNGQSAPSRQRENRIAAVLVLLAAVAIAFVSARPYAGGWNDGSRLASVESLVDHHTWAIDNSIFVVPPPCDEHAPRPYPREIPGLLEEGTGDKMFVRDPQHPGRGHFYSDKPPVPSLL